MNRKIAILRGINVGGKRKILMADLKSMFEGMKLSNISTYIQSGNVIFDSAEKINDLELSKKIETAIDKIFGFSVPVVIRTPKEIEQAISHNPFYREGTEITNLHLTFLNEKPINENLQQAESYNAEPDKFVIKEKDIFIYCVGKYHKSKLTNNFFEKKLKVSATTRNWKTVLKLLELSK
jgi:uncharacterized protein (DUF1697 family)